MRPGTAPSPPFITRESPDVTAATLDRSCSARRDLASLKRCRAYRCVERLPRGPGGKVSVAELLATHA